MVKYQQEMRKVSGAHLAFCKLCHRSSAYLLVMEVSCWSSLWLLASKQSEAPIPFSLDCQVQVSQASLSKYGFMYAHPRGLGKMPYMGFHSKPRYSEPTALGGIIFVSWEQRGKSREISDLTGSLCIMLRSVGHVDSAIVRPCLAFQSCEEGENFPNLLAFQP